jgi:preprotein translocase subunit SecA
MITIATNMAGRGTDIVLGGNIEKPTNAIRDDESLPGRKGARTAALKAEWQKVHDQVLAAGGLHIIGSERHESRRIDNQLRGRSGRQGDPGSSRFYLALDDPLLKIFAGERLNTIMVRLKMPEGEAIEHPLVSRSLESAQRKVEQRNFDIRKQLLEYDDVSNDQRKVIYQQRNELLDSEDIAETITAMRQGQIHDTFRLYVPAESVEEQWDVGGLETALAAELHLKLPVGEWIKAEPQLGDDDILKRLLDAGDAAYAEKTAALSMPPPGPASSAMSCCRASIPTGASTSRRSITCARASICAAMRRRTRSRNTSAKPSSCSRACCRRCAARCPSC